MNNDLNNENIKTSITCPSDSFVYTGKIKVSLMRGNKKCFTKEYTNHGRWPLFYFVNLCLRGDYDTADAMRPRFINIFDFASDENYPLVTGVNVPPIIVDGGPAAQQIGTYFKSANKVTLLAYPCMSLPDVSYTAGEVGTSSVVFKFTVPFTQIALKPSQSIQGFALYPVQTTAATDPTLFDNVSNPLVYFFLTDSDGKIANLLDGLGGTISLGDEYNIYIEWSLSITNQNTARN